jgi:hypothetical protein
MFLVLTKIKKVGSIMATTLIILSIVSILFTGFITYIISQINYSSHMAAKESALYVADAGIEFYKWYLAHETDGKQMQEILDFWEETSPYPHGVGIGNEYEVDYNGIGKYSIVVTPPVGGSSIITVESTGWTYKKPNAKRIVSVQMRVSSWSEYVLLSNSDLEIEDGENIQGKVHSNGGIKFDGVGHNTVSSAVSDYQYTGTGTTKDGVWTTWASEYNTVMDSEVFLSGKTFPAPAKDFDSVTASFLEIFDAAEEISLDFSPATKGHQVVLKGEYIDVFRVINTNDGVVTSTQDTSPPIRDFLLPDVGAIYVNKNIWVEGNIDSGKKLVIASNNPSVSHGNIFISNDITYNGDYSSGTVLGLVAKNDIEIVEDCESDLRIEAALLAQTGRVGRYDHGDTKSLITVFGAIATNQPYGFNGFTNKEIIFDNNLLFSPPPYFPIEGIYKTDHWSEI